VELMELQPGAINADPTLPVLRFSADRDTDLLLADFSFYGFTVGKTSNRTGLALSAVVTGTGASPTGPGAFQTAIECPLALFLAPVVNGQATLPGPFSTRIQHSSFCTKFVNRTEPFLCSEKVVECWVTSLSGKRTVVTSSAKIRLRISEIDYYRQREHLLKSVDTKFRRPFVSTHPAQLDTEAKHRLPCHPPPKLEP
jgi:hypothetical protein